MLFKPEIAANAQPVVYNGVKYYSKRMLQQCLGMNHYDFERRLFQFGNIMEQIEPLTTEQRKSLAKVNRKPKTEE